MSTINSEKLIEELEKNSIFRKVTNAEGKNVIEIIESQPPADQWIPCSSGKMPEHRQRAFITIRFTGNRRYVTTANYYTETGNMDEYDWEDEGFYSYDIEYGHCKYLDVIAWMPLPEPYKGVE